MNKLKYKHKRALFGYGFIAPWLVGFLLFFTVPIISSIVMSFNELSLKSGSLEYKFLGIENFKYALTGDEKFIPYLSECLLDLVIDVPLILICSFFFSLILNQTFKGNTLMKVVFFLPVILGNGVFALYQTQLLDVQGMSVEMIQAESESMLGGLTTSGLIEFMREAGLPDEVL